WDPARTLYVPDEVRAHTGRRALEAGARAQVEWETRFQTWSKSFPELAEEWRVAARGELPRGWEEALPSWKVGQDLATREAGGKVLNALAARIPWMIGGDADLSESTKTALEGVHAFGAEGGDGAARNVHYGVREHAMGAIANGLAYHGGLRTYTATFFVF